MGYFLIYKFCCRRPVLISTSNNQRSTNVPFSPFQKKWNEPSGSHQLGRVGGADCVEALGNQANFLMLLLRLEGGGEEAARFSLTPGHWGKLWRFLGGMLKAEVSSWYCPGLWLSIFLWGPHVLIQTGTYHW